MNGYRETGKNKEKKRTYEKWESAFVMNTSRNGIQGRKKENQMYLMKNGEFLCLQYIKRQCENMDRINKIFSTKI